MIIKILINGKEHAIRIYENNFNGNVEVQETYHVKIIDSGFDDIFGTNEQMTVLLIKEEEL